MRIQLVKTAILFCIAACIVACDCEYGEYTCLNLGSEYQEYIGSVKSVQSEDEDSILNCCPCNELTCDEICIVDECFDWAYGDFGEGHCGAYWLDNPCEQ